MYKVSHNIIYICCGIIGHNIDEFIMVLSNDEKLAPLAIDPDVILFSFNCRITAIDQHHIMIDPLAIMDANIVSICIKCHNYLSGESLPIDVLANFHWIRLVPGELKDLTWVEEALLARSHLCGGVFQLEERKHGEPAYLFIKGHIVLVS